MINEFFVTLTAGIIAVLPAPVAPDVIMPSLSVETSVIQHIQEQEKRTVTLECDFPSEELTISEGISQNFTCITTDTKNKETFNTFVAVSAVEGKVNVTAVVSLDQILKSTSLQLAPFIPEPQKLTPSPTESASTPETK